LPVADRRSSVRVVADEQIGAERVADRDERVQRGFSLTMFDPPEVTGIDASLPRQRGDGQSRVLPQACDLGSDRASELAGAAGDDARLGHGGIKAVATSLGLISTCLSGS
jgi:hypothetical protein